MKNTVDNKKWKEIDKEYHENKRVVTSYDRRITRKYRLEHKYFTIDKWIRRIAVEQNWPVLDFGSGTGTVTLKLLKSGIKTISCDASLAMLNELQRKARLAGLNCICVVTDVECLPFKNATFKALVCAGVLHHLPNIDRSIREQLRVIKNSGLLFISEPFKNKPWFSYVYWFPVNVIRATVSFLRRNKLKTYEGPLDKDDLVKITHIFESSACEFNISYLIYWPIIAGYLPEFIGYPLIAFLNWINKHSQRGDSVVIDVRK